MDFFQLLRNHISMNASRANCMYGMILGLLCFQNVQARHLAPSLPGRAKLDSKIRRIQRFFQRQALCLKDVGRLILSFLSLPEKVVLTLDRTHWMLGQTPINLLVVGVLIGGVSVPIAFMQLDKKGNSNTKERMRLINRVLTLIPAKRIECLLGDREFMGQEWFAALIKKNIPFAMRIKANTLMWNKRSETYVTVKEYAQQVTPGSYILETELSGFPLKLAFKKKYGRNKDMVFLAVFSENYKANWLTRYRQRWSIERMFLSMKTQGFNLEKTHLTAAERIEKLTALVSIAFAMAVRMGKIREEEKPIKTKIHGRKAYSIFTYGLNWIKEKISQALFGETKNNRIEGVLGAF